MFWTWEFWTGNLRSPLYLPSWLGSHLGLRCHSCLATRDGVTVTYSVCIGGAGIDYSSVTSILYTYSAFSITLRFFTPVG